MKQALVLAALLAFGCTTLSPARRAEVAVERAEKAKVRKDLETARAAYREAWDAQPTNLVAMRGLIEMHHRLGRVGELEPELRERVAVNPTDAWAHEALGLLLFAKGSVHGPEARKHLTEATKLAPEVADFHYRLGLMLVESDAYSDALEPLQKAVKEEPKEARYRLPYAMALARTGQRRAAVDELRAVLTLDPDRAEVALAERTAKTLLDPFRGFPPAAREQFELAMTWLSSEQPTQAQTVLDSLLDKYPELSSVHALSGLAAAKMDDAGRAIAAFRRASELDPDAAEPRLYLGDVYFSRGRPENAREHYEAALERNPFLPEAYRRLADVLLKAEEKEKAVDTFNTYLLLRPGDVDARLVHVALLSELRRPQANAAWDLLVKDFPNRIEVLVGYAKHYFAVAVTSSDEGTKKQAKDKARAALERAVELDPENATASALLAEVGKIR